MKARIWNASGYLEGGKYDVLYFNDLLVNAGFNVLKVEHHDFTPQGASTLWLLGESHFALHSFPEDNAVYWEISSCNQEMYFRFLLNLAKINSLI